MSPPVSNREGLTYAADRDAARSALLLQLVNEELAEVREGDVFVPWETVYEILASPDAFFVDAAGLGIPAVDPHVRISIACDSGVSVSDKKFKIRVAGFDRHGVAFKPEPSPGGGPWFVEGADREFLLSRETWAVFRFVGETRRRDEASCDRESNLMVLADARRLAEDAGAGLDTYLRRTRVLRPKEVLLDVRASMLPAGKLVEVIPRFEGQPDGWLQTFDNSHETRSVYRIPDGKDYWEIIVDEPVRMALAKIKKLPGRRVVGPDANAFISNPFAYFGPEVAAVFNEGNIEDVVEELQRDNCRFSIASSLDEPGPIEILIEPVGLGSRTPAVLESVDSIAVLRTFCRRLKDAMLAGSSVFEWRQHQIGVDADAETKLETLTVHLAAWIDHVGGADGDDGNAPSGPVVPIDLSIYADRIEGIGIETPYSIIKIPRPASLGAWLPEDIVATISPVDPGMGGGTDLTRNEVEELRRKVIDAEKSGATHVQVGSKAPIRIDDAKTIIDQIDTIAGVSNDPLDKPVKPKRTPKPSLLIASNIDDDDYVEQRKATFAVPVGRDPQLPASLRPHIALKDHQRRGVAWLQHLFGLGADNCRGALLADDMGLGKTLQLLTVVLRYFEDDSSAGPALVIAPVSLLENWRAEIDKFFEVEPATVFSLYGDGVRKNIAGPGDTAPALYATERKLLRDGWVGDARIVLTTYETVRDLEFSLAEVNWSFVICDEAQRIKNPNALLTRATKKLKARFRVAATGTPVENSLQDIWSIFDFIQPGLLDPLNRFARNYQRPIEARTPEQRERMDALRALLAPQILRRTKEEVAKDLPEKRFDQPSRELVMSAMQLEKYRRAIADANVQAIGANKDRAMATINVLQRLRRICCDPFVGQDHPEIAVTFDEYRRAAPKFDWLVNELEGVRDRGEKAIVFVEARDVQRQLKIQLDRHFGLAIEIINGTTSTTAGSEKSRQAIVDRFQAREGFGVIILSPLAAGVGLNIQAANRVIHYMRHWNPAREDQATDRAYRIGQERPVTVYTPIVRGDGFPSFDERLDQLLEYKRELARDMYNGADDVTPDDFIDILDL